MGQLQILKGATANLPFSTRDASRNLVNADSLPTITGVQVSGSAIATTGFSIVQQQDQTPANITGRYYARITNTVTSGFTDRATGEIQISATIGGVTCTEEIKFVVVAASSATPYIDVD